MDYIIHTVAECVCRFVGIGTPHPLPRKRVCVPPCIQRGEEQQTLPCGWGSGGGPITTIGKKACTLTDEPECMYVHRFWLLEWINFKMAIAYRLAPKWVTNYLKVKRYRVGFSRMVNKKCTCTVYAINKVLFISSCAKVYFVFSSQ